MLKFERFATPASG